MDKLSTYPTVTQFCLLLFSPFDLKNRKLYVFLSYCTFSTICNNQLHVPKKKQLNIHCLIIKQLLKYVLIKNANRVFICVDVLFFKLFQNKYYFY